MIERSLGGEVKHLRPLSSAQSGIWFAQTLAPESAIFNLAEFLEIAGPLDPVIFEEAVRGAVAETDSLHVHFVETDEGPRQYLSRPTDWEIPFLDLVGDSHPRANAEAWMRGNASRPDDLGRWPFFTIALIRLAPDRFLYYQRFHHIVMDGASLAIFAQRVADRYSALAEGGIPERRRNGSWLDVLDEEADYRRSHRFASDREYWLALLADRRDPETVSGLPPARSGQLIKWTGRLPRHVADALRELARPRGAGLASTITAAAAHYLHRLSNARDLILGISLAIRIGKRNRRIAGMVSGILPIRLAIDPLGSFTDLVEQTVQRMRATLRHERYRTEDLRHDLAMRPDEAAIHGLTVNVMPFDYNLRLGEYPVVAQHYIANGPLLDDLAIVVYDSNVNGADLRIDFDANADHYTAEFLAAHHGRFLELLARLAASPGMPLHQLDILAAGERQQLLEEFNATAMPVPAATLPGLFEAQAMRTPETVALFYEGQELTYGELNARANRLAHHLSRLGVGPETLVGICLERSAETVVGILAVLKAGGAYLPLEPDYPHERLAFMLRDAQARILLAQTRQSSGLPQHQARTLCPDSDRDAIAQESPENLAAEISPDNLAYVMYTSGSTGRPKGVAVPHRAIVRLLFGADYARLDASVTLLQMSPTSFDASTFELWGALLHGGRCDLFPGRVPTAAELGRVIRQRGINTLWLTAALFNAVVDEAPELLSPLEQLLIGGEALSVRHVSRFLAACPRTRLVNGYGPTEGTTFSCCYRIPGDFDVSRASVPIGLPIGNTQGIRAGPLAGAGALGCSRRAIHRRRWARAGLPEPGGPDCRAFRGRPPRDARDSDVPHRRPGAMATRRHARVPRPGG